MAVVSKERKSAVELADLIRHAMHEPELRCAVYSDVSGWRAKVYAAAMATNDLQKRVNLVSAKLNERYDLYA